MNDIVEQDRIGALTEDALDAFWAVIAKGHPTAVGGDLDPEVHDHLEAIATAAVARWVELNVPQRG